VAFVQRLLTATFVLGEGAFGNSGNNTVTISGAGNNTPRMSCRISKAGGNAMPTAQATIYGMSLSQMNALSTLGLLATIQRRNSITIQAGDSNTTPATVFQGTIQNAWVDAGSQPDVCFQVEAFGLMIQAVTPAQPTSVGSQVNVTTLLSSLASQMNLTTEFNGVSVLLPSVYYAGSPLIQARQIVHDAGLDWNSGDNGVLAVWYPGFFRTGTIPIISPSTGMIGYPTFNSNGIQVRTLFNPNVFMGSQIQVQSSLQGASGTWGVYGVDHDLEANMPHGAWFSTIQAAPPGYVAVPST